MENARMVSSFEGGITAFALAMPGNTPLENALSRFQQEYGDLMRHFPTGAVCYWLLRSEGELSPFESHGIHVVPVRVLHEHARKGNFRWIQDPFLCLCSPDEGELVVPVHAPEHDQEALFKLSFATGRAIRPVDFYFEGGNLLACGQFLLVGMDIAAQNHIPQHNQCLLARGADWANLEAKLRAVTGQSEILWLGSAVSLPIRTRGVSRQAQSWQPFFHIDLFVLPAGRNAHGQLRIFVGELPDEFVMADDRHDLELLREGLETVVGQIQQAIPNVEVRRLPMVLLIDGKNLTFYSYCNSVMSWEAEYPQVFMPAYEFGDAGLPAAKLCTAAARAVAAEMEGLGIQARFIKMDFTRRASEGGALHCALKVLSRNT